MADTKKGPTPAKTTPPTAQKNPSQAKPVSASAPKAGTAKDPKPTR